MRSDLPSIQDIAMKKCLSLEEVESSMEAEGTDGNSRLWSEKMTPFVSLSLSFALQARTFVSPSMFPYHYFVL